MTNPDDKSGSSSSPQTSTPKTNVDHSNPNDIGQTARQAVDQFGQAINSGDAAQKKLIAGLLGIFLGSLGVHKFYLGMNNAGIIMLVATIGGWILGTIGSIIVIGAIFFIVPFLVSVLGLIEGILYLTKNDQDFQREYITGKKPWL